MPGWRLHKPAAVLGMVGSCLACPACPACWADARPHLLPRPTFADAADAAHPSAADLTSSFTPRTRLVLAALQRALGAPSLASSAAAKRRHLQHAAAANASVSVGSLMQQCSSRMDASRWFFELLVLQNKGYVALSQQGAYGDVQVLPRPQLVGA